MTRANDTVWVCQHGSTREGYATPTASCDRRAVSACVWRVADREPADGDSVYVIDDLSVS